MFEEVTILSVLLIILGGTLLLFLYFLPSIIGRTRKSFAGILLLNIFLGGIGLFWLIALLWAIFGAKKTINNISVTQSQSTKQGIAGEMQQTQSVQINEKEVKDSPWLLVLIALAAIAYLIISFYLVTMFVSIIFLQPDTITPFSRQILDKMVQGE